MLHRRSVTPKSLWPLLLGLLLLTYTSCNRQDEPDPVFGAPQLSLSGDNSGMYKPGDPVSVTLNLNAEGGSKSLVVNRDGGFLEEITLDATASTYTYATETVPATAEEGDAIEYSFILVNQQDTESSPVEYTANVAVYDPVTIGTTEVYAVALPEDGIISEGQTVKFARGRNYFLAGPVSFAPGSRLEIEPGVTVYLNTEADPVSVVIDNAEAEIVGTSTEPIVMTSDKVLRGTAPEPGDWGIFNIRGGGAGTSQGRIQYLRLEYPTARAFRLQNVGDGTEISYVQVYYANGEGFMPTDGNVNMSHLVATNCRGGGFRLGDEYSGNIQYLIAVTSEASEEADDLSIRENSTATVSNATFIGPGADYPQNTHGIRLRASSQGKVYNTIVAEYPRRGVRGTDEIQVTDINGPTVFAHSYVFNVGNDPFANLALPFAGTFDPQTGERLDNPFNNNITSITTEGYTANAIPGIGVNDYVPEAETASEFNPTALGDFFQAAPFVGAIRNADEDWTRGWVKNPDDSIRP
jgi:hypothetical protein